MALLIEYREGSDLAYEVLKPTTARWRLAGSGGRGGGWVPWRRAPTPLNEDRQES